MDYVGWSVPSEHGVYRAKLEVCQVHITSPPEDITVFFRSLGLKMGLAAGIGGQAKRSMCCVQIENFQVI
jgi:hypothetical protein